MLEGPPLTFFLAELPKTWAPRVPPGTQRLSSPLQTLHGLVLRARPSSSLSNTARVSVLFSVSLRPQLKWYFAEITPPLQKVQRDGAAGWLREPGIEPSSAPQLPTPAQVGRKQLSASQTSVF